MRKRRRGARLAQEPLALRSIGGEFRLKHFERDGAIEAQVAREIHGAHPAAPELTLDPVAAVECVFDSAMVDECRLQAGDRIITANYSGKRQVPQNLRLTVLPAMANDVVRLSECHRRLG